METKRSEALFARAGSCIPGGVNSPVRAFLSVGGTPRFIRRADKAYLYDEDGNRYLDYIGSWGPMLLGQNHPAVREAVIKAAEDGLSFGAATEKEVEMAEFLCDSIPFVEMIRMVNSGTEAVMSAIRAARGFTGREKIIKFEGCYHGHADAMLVKAGSGVMTAGVPDSSGVPAGCARDTLTAVYNDLESVKTLFLENPGEIACLIVEPVAANMGLVLPEEGFLQGLRDLCTKEGAVLIFDEVITGFRLSFGGAAEVFGISPDLVTYGKIIGGGMPVGAYGGRKEIMRCIAPSGTVYQAGTLSGNPIAMAAGLAQLSILKGQPEIYENVNKTGTAFAEGMRAILEKYHAACTVNQIGSLACVFFTPQKVKNYEIAKTSDTNAFAAYFHHMLSHGFSFAPSQFEAIFFSAAHTMAHISDTLACAEKFFRGI